MKTAVVTGGHGFVGKYLIAHLREEEIGAVSLDLKAGLDVRNYEEVRVTLEQAEPDYVFHLAAQAYVPESTTDVRRAFSVNIEGTLNVLEAVRNLGLRSKVLITGTSEEYGYGHKFIDEETPLAPTTPYGATKAAAGLLGLAYAKTHGLHVVVTRAFNHTGPGHSSAYAISAFARRVAIAERTGDKVIHGNLSTVRNYTDVRDVVKAYLLAADQEPGVYNICSSNSVDMEYVLTQLCSRANKAIQTELDNTLYRDASAHFPEVTYQKLHGATGWEPSTPLTQTLADTLDHWRYHV